jgi:hypothetical protein
MKAPVRVHLHIIGQLKDAQKVLILPQIRVHRAVLHHRRAIQPQKVLQLPVTQHRVNQAPVLQTVLPAQVRVHLVLPAVPVQTAVQAVEGADKNEKIFHIFSFWFCFNIGFG